MVIIKVVQNIKKSLLHPFECPPSHKNFRKNSAILQILGIFHIFTFLEPKMSHFLFKT